MIHPDESPAWPTTMRARLRDGRLMGTDGSVWVYRAVPMSPVVDAKSPGDTLTAAEPMLAAFEELASMTSYSMARRSVAKQGYREFHALLINIPQFFVPERRHPIAEYLRQNFGGVATDRRILLFGVKLQAKVGGAGGGLRAAIDSVVETIVAGGTPLSDFDADHQRVNAALDAAGLGEASAEEIRLANSWWNHGEFPDTPLLVHADHLHVFNSADAVRIADSVGVDDCSVWEAKGVPGQHAISFASVQELDMPFIDASSPEAAWISGLLSSGALVVSVRGQVEPSAITRAELRRQRKRYIDDINERSKSGKMERAEQQEMLDMLSGVEGMYATGGNPSPTVAGASVVVGFDGQVGDINQYIGGRSQARLSMMLYRQPGAMAETMLCSNIRANPNLHDVPSQVVACSGMPSLNLVGDTDGALVGFTERDRQPAYLSPSAASAGDASPVCVVPGQTGPQPLDTRIPVPVSEKFPTGWARFGDLAVGDLVYTRRGTTTPIVELQPIRTQPLHTVHLSDGQQIECGDNHLWAASDFAGRSSQSPSYVARTEADKASVAKRAAKFRDLALGYTSERDTLRGLNRDFGLSPAFIKPLVAVLDAQDETRTVEAPGRKKEFLVSALVDHLKNHPFGGVAGTDARDIIERLHALGDTWLGGDDIHRAATGAAPANRDASRWVRQRAATGAIPFRKVASGRAVEVRTYRVADVLNAVAEFYEAQAARRMPVVNTVSTAEMMESLQRTAGGANWAIPVADAIPGKATVLPVDPYVMGAWLGDGTSRNGQITSNYKIEDGLTTEQRRADQAYMIEEIEAAGYQVKVLSHSDMVLSVAGLPAGLAAAGVLRSKHIPAAYLRASYDQRLALLQGLMDTDGTVSKTGSCELALSDERLADGALELIRSLGIKASKSVGPSRYRDADGNLVECKKRHRITFTATIQVFRLPRKTCRIQNAVRSTQDWLYVNDITVGEPVEMRCITVADDEHLYLTDGFVPTHNSGKSVLMLNLADQFARSGRPVVVWDPKQESDHSPVVEASGGQVYSLDRLLEADGVFDPIRFSNTKEVGVELAASMLMSINPWGDYKNNFEVPLQHALSYGVEHGASCIGQALAIAKRDLELPQGLVERVEVLATSSPQFRAIVGINPQGEGLRAASGITLIKVGSAYLDLPEAGQPPASIQQKIALALVRMVVFGSAMAVSGRDGVVMLDEAWIVLGAGRAEIERLGRLARSQRVLPMLFTQRVTDALNAGLAGYISRGLILPMEDPDEAAAACHLFKLEPTPERMARLTAKATVGGNSATGKAPNWGSMRALRDPKTDKVIRGSIAIYADLAGRAIPVEVRLSDEFLLMASTNPNDIERRNELLARRRAEMASANAVAALDTGLGAGGAVLEGVF